MIWNGTPHKVINYVIVVVYDVPARSNHLSLHHLTVLLLTLLQPLLASRCSNTSISELLLIDILLLLHYLFLAFLTAKIARKLRLMFRHFCCSIHLFSIKGSFRYSTAAFRPLTRRIILHKGQIILIIFRDHFSGLDYVRASY